MIGGMPTLPPNQTGLAFSLARDLHGFSEEELASIDFKQLSDKIRRIHQGLSAEHEFAAIASWLGKCVLLTQPDQVHASDGTYRAPDFIVVVRSGQREILFLVEVKNKQDDRLVWSNEYLTSLQRFAALLKMPLLVAWKRYGLWTMVDSVHFAKRETAYHLSFETAMKNNLMSRLFGNVWLQTAAQFRMEIGMDILDPIDPEVELLPEGGYQCVIREAGFWTENGKLPSSFSPEAFPLLLACGGEPRTERSGIRITQIFPTQQDTTFNLSDILLAQMSWRRDSENPIDWAVELRNGLPKGAEDFEASLRRMLDAKVLRYVLQQEPETVPGFLNVSEQ